MAAYGTGGYGKGPYGIGQQHALASFGIGVFDTIPLSLTTSGGAVSILASPAVIDIVAEPVTGSGAALGRLRSVALNTSSHAVETLTGGGVRLRAASVILDTIPTSSQGGARGALRHETAQMAMYPVISSGGAWAGLQAMISAVIEHDPASRAGASAGLARAMLAVTDVSAVSKGSASALIAAAMMAIYPDPVAVDVQNRSLAQLAPAIVDANGTPVSVETAARAILDGTAVLIVPGAVGAGELVDQTLGSLQRIQRPMPVEASRVVGLVPIVITRRSGDIPIASDRTKHGIPVSVARVNRREGI